MASWADIQKLAAELQLAQNIESEKKLSDVNVIEIVSKLRDLRMIDIVFTGDGKEYVTRKHLKNEIKNECVEKKGRISFDELVMNLNVEYEHITDAVRDITTNDNQFICHQSELYTKDFMDNLCIEISNKLDEFGTMSVLTLTKMFDLPTTIINNYIINEIGGKINATRDGDQIYTRNYLIVQKVCIASIIGSLTKVIPIEQILDSISLSNTIFWGLWNELENEKLINGKVFGSKNVLKGTYYIPDCFTKLCNKYIKNKFDSDSLFEISILKKFFMANVDETFDTIYGKDFSKKNIVQLESIVIKNDKLEELVSEMKNEIKSNEYIYVLESINEKLSISLEEEDAEIIGQKYLKPINDFILIHSDEGSLICYSKTLIDKIRIFLEPIVKELAGKEAPNLIITMKEQSKVGKQQQNSDDEDWGTIKSGKGGKKKGGFSKKSSKKSKTPETHKTKIQLPNKDLLLAINKENIAPKNIVDTIYKDISNGLEDLFNSEIEKTITSLSLSININQKRNRKLLEESARALYHSFCIFEQGTLFFTGMFYNKLFMLNIFIDKTGSDLKDYLLKNTGIEFSNIILTIVSGIEDEDFTIASKRDKVIKNMDCNDDVKEDIISLYSATNSGEVDKFHEAVKVLGNKGGCGLVFDKPNKESSEDILQKYKEGLKDALSNSNDHATSLLLIILILFAERLNVAIKASGKFVGNLIINLKLSNKINEDESSLLVSSQGAVIEIFKSKGNADPILKEQLDEAIDTLKRIVT
uniref:E3 UFM1-protein ligase 1 homolog n=1 Tax=Parastrongyloides trichosuri TaxID=131310 RepID=A0A0N4ZNS8_PARTI